MMTSWALVCNVWYLPAMHQQEGEDAVQFANRVKAAIATQGGLVDLQWDGGLKRGKVKESFKEQQQKQFSSMVVGDDSSNSDRRLRSVRPPNPQLVHIGRPHTKFRDVACCELEFGLF